MMWMGCERQWQPSVRRRSAKPRSIQIGHRAWPRCSRQAGTPRDVMDGDRSSVARAETEPEVRPAGIVAVERMLREGQVAEAERQCRSILAERRADGRALYLLSEAQRRLGKLAPALQSIEQALVVAPNDALS